MEIETASVFLRRERKRASKEAAQVQRSPAPG